MRNEIPELMLLAVAIAIALPLERMPPAHRQPVLRAQIVTDGLHLMLTSALSKVFFQIIFGARAIAPPGVQVPVHVAAGFPLADRHTR